MLKTMITLGAIGLLAISVQPVLADHNAGHSSSLAGALPALEARVTALENPPPVTAVTVNCVSGQTIADALTNRTPLVVTINGSCSEHVTITTDDITLQGGAGGEVVGPDSGQNTISLLGANRVVIKDLTVRGGRNCIQLSNGASATISGNTVGSSMSADTCGRNGIDLGFSSSAIIVGNWILNATRHGVAVVASTAHIFDNDIRDTGRDGVTVINAGHVTLGPDFGFTIAQQPGNTIQNNARHGVQIFGLGSGNLADNTISGNNVSGGSGVDLQITLGSFGSVSTDDPNTILTCGITALIDGPCPQP